MEKEILSIADASQLLSLSEAEVERLLAAGEIPGRRVGPHWFISRQRLLQFIAGEEIAPARKPVPAPELLNALPPKVLAPNWRCDTCHDILAPDFVECPRCGTARNTPLIGYRLPRPVSASQLAAARKVN